MRCYLLQRTRASEWSQSARYVLLTMCGDTDGHTRKDIDDLKECVEDIKDAQKADRENNRHLVETFQKTHDEAQGIPPKQTRLIHIINISGIESAALRPFYVQYVW